MKIGWLFLALAFAMLIHHFHKHGYWYDPEDLRTLKWKSHEFWIVLLTILGMVLNGVS